MSFKIKGPTTWWTHLAAWIMLSALPLRAAVMVHEFYLPLPEQQIRSAFVSLSSATRIGNEMETVFSIVVTGPDTVIHYDHWEDGYEVDINNPKQSTTEIWGDGDDSNGIAPGFEHDPMGLPMGTVITLRNDVGLPRNPAVKLYDARDRVAATKALVVTRAAWSTKTGPLLACAVEVQATIDYGTSFIAPVGEDVDANKMFDYVGLFVMSSSDNTVLTVDPDGSGPKSPVTVTLNQGESYHLDGGVMKGATVTASKPVQAHLITGHKNANYEARWFTLYPVEDWHSSYVTPVGTAANGHETYMFIYNPHGTDMVINYKSRTGNGTFTVGAGKSFQWQVPRSSGAILTSDDGRVFSAVSTVGAKPSNNNAYDWGFAPVPADGLTTELIVGWGPGSVDLSKNGSPVWVTAEADTTIYIDYKGDNSGSHVDAKGNHYDEKVTLAALESKTIYAPGNDQTAMRIYTLDGVRLAAAWGQDPATAGSGNPYLDMGTAVLPHPIPVVEKNSKIEGGDGSEGFKIGDILTYTVTVDNKGLLPLGNTIVIDELPVQLKYIAGSTTYNGEPLPDDDVGATLFPLDEGGFTIPLILRGGSSVFTYKVEIVAGGRIINTVGNPEYELEIDNIVDVLPPEGSHQCVIEFTDGSGTPVMVYSVNDDIYLRMTDVDANLDSAVVESVTVYVKNNATGDIEPMVLTETSSDSGIFVSTTPLPSSATSGLAQEDGVLHARPGDILYVSYQDPIYGDFDDDNAVISAPSEIKPLYLKPGGVLNRNNPVAAGTTTHAQTAVFGGNLEPATITTVGPAAVSNTGQKVNTHTFSYNSGTSGDNRILIVGISYYGSQTISTVTYGGQSLVEIGKANNENNARMHLYQVAAPPTGSNNLVVNWSGNLSYGAVVGAVTYAGVDQESPTRTFASNTETGNEQSVTVSAVAGDLVVGVVAGKTGDPYVVAGNGTKLWSELPYSGSVALLQGSTAGAAQQRVATGTSETLRWTGTGGVGAITYRQWAAGGVALKPAMLPVMASLTFTQTPAFCKNFVMPAGGALSAVNYVQLASGELPENPALKAVLKSGSTVIATLTNPTAEAVSGSSGVYAVQWFGGLGSEVTIPSGSSFSLTIENSTEVAMSLLHDSATYPARIELPASTVIAVESLEFYDAPYPGGEAVDSMLAGSTVYVRTEVSDPFGAYDITNLDIECSGVGLETTLGDSKVVATTSCTKIYEYPLQIGSEGSYPVTVTANEGSEGVIDSAAKVLEVFELDTGTPGLVEFTTGNNGTQTSLYEPDEVVYVRVTDADQNKDPDGIDTVVVVITTASGDKESVTLYETGVNTGVFTAAVPVSSTTAGAQGDGTLYLPPGTSLSVDYVDPDDPDDHSSDSATVPMPQGEPGISISKSLTEPGSGVVMVGEPVVYTLKVSNIGGVDLPTVTVQDIYPAANLSFVGALPTATASGSGSVSWSNLGPLAVGASKSIQVLFTAEAPANLATNVATVDAGSGLTDVSQATVEIIKPELAITKTILAPETGPVAVGATITYQIVVANIGTTPITTLPLEDSFSRAYLRFVSASITPDGVGAGSLFWADLAADGALLPTHQVTLQVVMEVVGGGNPVLNRARADYAQDTYGNDVPPAAGEVGIETRAVTISGSVFNDPDQTMTGTVGLGGVTVTLYSDPDGEGDLTNAEVSAIVTTQADGSYEFPNLSLGNYIVVQSDLPGMVSTGDTDGANDNRIAIDVATLQDYDGNNFYDYTPPIISYASVSGAVLLDMNGDGVIDLNDTNGISGVTVELIHDLNGNGVYDQGEPVIQSQQTGVNGKYSFGAVLAGRYVIRQTDLPGYVSTADIDGGDYNQIALQLADGQKSTGNNFYDTKVGRIGHKVWNDRNGNGIQDDGEPGIAGVTVHLYRSADMTGRGVMGGDNEGTDELLSSVVTDASGSYVFTELMPGSYYVVVERPIGYFVSPQGEGGDPTADSDGDASGKSGIIILGSGGIEADIDFGFYEEAMIYGYAFADADDSGTRTAPDGAANGMEVQLWSNGQKIATVMAAADGYYEFTGLDKGIYEVIFVCGNDALIPLPAEGTSAAQDEARNRAEVNSDGHGRIVYDLTPGAGISDYNPGEPLNAGFKGTGPMSSGIDLRAYAAADGVYVEFIAYDVEIDGEIMIFLLNPDGSLAWYGFVPVQAAAEQFARIKVPGLQSGESHNFAVIDEIGKVWFADNIKVETFSTRMVSMTNNGVKLTFDTLVGRTYAVQWTARLGDPWQALTSVKALREKTTVIVTPPESPTGFFKIVLKE